MYYIKASGQETLVPPREFTEADRAVYYNQIVSAIDEIQTALAAATADISGLSRSALEQRIAALEAQRDGLQPLKDASHAQNFAETALGQK
jgi:hypothetical protein